jgi:2-hydroxychromene-2-carboxylate isomerase
MTKTLEFIFDFASPNAYLAWRALPPVLARTGADMKVIPCLLGGIFKATNNQAPMVAYAPIKGKMEYERLEFARFLRRHALAQFRFNPHFPVNSLLLMRSLVAAQKLGVADRLIEMGLAAMWEQGLKMDDPAVAAKAYADAGFDAEALLAGAADPANKAELAANTEAAVQRGAFGVPTFYVGSEMFFGKERLGQVEEELAK